MVVVLHAIDLALRYGDRIVTMRNGQLVADGPATEALPALSTAFGLPFGVDLSPRLLPPG